MNDWSIDSIDRRAKSGSHRRGIRASRMGFTLIEMLIVIVLISMVTAFSLPKIDYTQFRLDAGMRTMRVALQRGQSYAVSSQRQVLVGIDLLGKHRICVLEDADNNGTYTAGEHWTMYSLQDGVQFGTPTTPATWAGALLPTAPLTATATVTFTCNPTDLTTYTGVVFRGDGAVSSAAQVYITSKRGKAGDWRGNDLEQATGKVTPYKLPSNGGSTWLSAGF
jgi:prepilin-type N-terminal cleavage/methylation domain-containing protein